ncbi:MAG: D-alanyl-D-alanine carboxypeptidase, partial [Ilumatobacteraceae bacterium]
AVDSDPVVNIYAFPDPATFARTAFIEALGRAGVTVTGDPVATNPDDQLPSIADVEAAPGVAELTSLPLAEELTYVLKVSYNLGAETMICRLAIAAGSTDCEDGMVKAAEIWDAAGLDTEGASLIDGSGLTGNLITAANQVQLQTIMAQRPDADRWKATLPILGVDGSLALVSPDSPAAGQVSAKTGTLVGGDSFNGRYRIATKSLGGYIDTASGRRFAFAIIATESMFPDIEGIFAANDDVGDVAAIIQQNN